MTRPHILLCIWDSLRHDRLSCAGYSRETTPTLDQLAAAGTRLCQWYSPTAPTRPALATLLSGQSPLGHGIVGKRHPRRPRAGMTSLAEELQRAGYETIIVDSLVHRRTNPWLRRGFEQRIDMSGSGRSATAFDFNRAVRRGLRGRRGRPLFLVVRYCDPHTPYLPPERYRRLFYEGDPTGRNVGSLGSFYEEPHKEYFQREWAEPLLRDWRPCAGGRIEDVEFLRAMYDAEIRVADDGLLELRSMLDEATGGEPWLEVVTADHGESLGEHGVYFGHAGLRDTVLHIPAVIAGPGVRAQVLHDRLETPDLAPTLLESVGLAVPPGMEGRSFAAALAGHGPAPAARDLLASECTFFAAWALRSDVTKVIVPRDDLQPPQLYDLADDPREEQNLATLRPEEYESWRRRLEQRLAEELEGHDQREDPVLEGRRYVGDISRERGLLRRVRRGLRTMLRRRPARGKAYQVHFGYSDLDQT